MLRRRPRSRRSSLNYNGRELLDVILPSLAAQTYPHLTVIVLDNGSSDGSAAYLRERWPHVRVVALPENVGVAAALNRGLETVETELVALLNNDIELEPRWLEQLVAAARTPPRGGIRVRASCCGSTVAT